MYVLVAGGGKVGANLTRSLVRLGHEVTLVEQRRDRFDQLEDEFGHQIQNGDATEVFLLELRRENLEIVEVQIDKESPSAGKRVEALVLPEGAQLISVVRNGQAQIANGSTRLEPGDQVLAILQPGKEDELRRVLLKA